MEQDTFLTVSKEILEKGKSVRFTASGWSMRPLIQNGDIVTASPIDGCRVGVGDILLCITEKNGVVAHRMIGWRRNRRRKIALIKGDACLGAPDAIPVKNILGRITSVERNGRRKRLDTIGQKVLSLVFAAISASMPWTVPALTGKRKMRLNMRC